jgi:hypothetical protein
LLVVGAMLTLFIPVVDHTAMGVLLGATGMAVQSYFTSRKAQNEADGPPLPPPSDGSGTE